MVTYAIILKDTIKKEKEIYETEELTYYYKDNEQESFEKWKNNNYSYAVMEIVVVLNQ